MPLHIFRSRNFTLMSLIGFITGFVMFGATLFLPLYQQSVQGASATNSGLLLLPMLGAMLVTSMVAGRVTTNTGRYKVFPIVGSVLMIVGLYLLSTMDTGTSRFTSGVFMAVRRPRHGLPDADHHAGRAEQRRDEGHGRRVLVHHPLPYARLLLRRRDHGRAVQPPGPGRHDRAGRALGSKITEKSAQLDAASLEKLPAAAREAYQHAVSAGTHSAFLLGAIVAVVALVAAVFVKEVAAEGSGPAEAGGGPGGRRRVRRGRADAV